MLENIWFVAAIWMGLALGILFADFNIWLLVFLVVLCVLLWYMRDGRDLSSFGWELQR